MNAEMDISKTSGDQQGESQLFASLDRANVAGRVINHTTCDEFECLHC